MNVKRTVAPAIFVLIAVFSISAQSAKPQNQETQTQAQNDKIIIVYNEDFEKGKEFFQLNKPEQAIDCFERCIDSPNINPDIFIYLGVAYYQLNRFEDSLAIFERGLATKGTNRKILAYNAGNSAFALSNYTQANTYFAVAINEDPSFSSAILNRANTLLRLDRLSDARENYALYLELESESAQKEKIEQLLLLLDEEIARRAKEMPELLPSNFDLGEEADRSSLPPEKVTDNLPYFNSEDNFHPQEQVSNDVSSAPALPVEEKKSEPQEKLSESDVTKAPDLPAEPQKETEPQEKVSEPDVTQAPDLPAQKSEKDSVVQEKVSDEEIRKQSEKTEKTIDYYGTVPAVENEPVIKDAPVIDDEAPEPEKLGNEENASLPAAY